MITDRDAEEPGFVDVFVDDPGFNIPLAARMTSEGKEESMTSVDGVLFRGVITV